MDHGRGDANDKLDFPNISEKWEKKKRIEGDKGNRWRKFLWLYWKEQYFFLI